MMLSCIVRALRVKGSLRVSYFVFSNKRSMSQQLNYELCKHKINCHLSNNVQFAKIWVLLF